MSTLDKGNLGVLALSNELEADDELAVRFVVDDNKSQARVTVICVVARQLCRAEGTASAPSLPVDLLHNLHIHNLACAC